MSKKRKWDSAKGKYASLEPTRKVVEDPECSTEGCEWFGSKPYREVDSQYLSLNFDKFPLNIPTLGVLRVLKDGIWESAYVAVAFGRLGIVREGEVEGRPGLITSPPSEFDRICMRVPKFKNDTIP